MTIEERIMEAINKGESEEFLLKKVGNGNSFRGYIISDAATGIRIADYVYSYALDKFELKMKSGYERELEAAKEILPKEEANALLYCDYHLCLQYVEYVENYIENLLNHRGLDLKMQPAIKKNLQALKGGYGTSIMLAGNDVEDYSGMPGFEEQVKKSIAEIRRLTIEFEDQFLKLFPEGLSFNHSPIYLDVQRKQGMQ